MDVRTERFANSAGGGAGGRRVVVGVDGSPGARVALAYALTAAARRGVPVEVVSTFPIGVYWMDFYAVDLPNTDAVRADTEAKARALVEEVRREPAVARVAGVETTPVQVTVEAGPAAEQLLRLAADAGLLVVGSRGRGGVRSAVLGSVALHCVAHARGPVVVAHPTTYRPREQPRVVVGVDGSDRSRAALVQAVQEAVRLGASVDVVTAYRLLDFWTEGYLVDGPSGDELGQQTQRSSETWVADVLEELRAGRPGDLPTVRTVALPGAAAEVLVEQSRSADLLVVGSRGRGELRGLLLGSVALHCAMHAACPVLVVHPRPNRTTGHPAEKKPAAAGD